jgi:hypothetical protein
VRLGCGGVCSGAYFPSFFSLFSDFPNGTCSSLTGATVQVQFEATTILGLQSVEEDIQAQSKWLWVYDPFESIRLLIS